MYFSSKRPKKDAAVSIPVIKAAKNPESAKKAGLTLITEIPV